MGGKPSVTIAIGHGEPHPEGSTQDNAKNPPGGGDGAAGEPVTCPNCQCEFNPATGEILNGDGPDSGETPPMDAGPVGEGSDLGAKLKAMMGGGGA